MLTALTVKKHERRKGMKGLVDRLKRDRAVVQVKRARGVYLKQITYISYGRKPRFEKLEKIIGDSKNRIICSPKIDFHDECGFRRFENSDFRFCLIIFLPRELIVGTHPDAEQLNRCR